VQAYLSLSGTTHPSADSLGGNSCVTAVVGFVLLCMCVCARVISVSYFLSAKSDTLSDQACLSVSQ